MTKEGKLTLADSIPNDSCFTIEELSDEFSLSSLRMRQVVEKALKSKVVQNLTKKDGRRILFAPQMVEQLKSAADKGLLGKFNKKRATGPSLNRAELILTIPIFDDEIVDLLRRKFKSDDAIAKYAKSHLEEIVKPMLAKKRELMEKFQREMQGLFSPEEISNEIGL